MPPVSYRRRLSYPGHAVNYYTSSDPWASLRNATVNINSAGPSRYPQTPVSIRKRPFRGSTTPSARKRIAFTVDKPVDNVPGFDGRNGGGKRRRARKGNGKRTVMRRKSRKASKRSKKYVSKRRKIGAKKRLPKKSSILKNGCYRTEYSTGTLTGSGERCLYIGHSDVVQADMLTVFCFAIIKNCFQGAGVEVRTMNDPPRGIELNDNFIFQYRVTNTAAMSTSTITVTSTSAAISTYADALVTVLTGLANEDQVILESLTFTPALLASSTIPRFSLSLRNAKVTFHLRSEFRLQNETVIGSNVETTDVNAVDLVGKFYSGNGTGTSFLNDRDLTVPFVAERTNGLIGYAPSASVNSIIRPLDKQMLSNCAKSGPFTMKAGSDIKSVITGTYTMNIDRWMRFINLDNAPTYPLLKLGKYRFYGLEKKFLTGTADQVIVRYANRATVGVQLKYYKSRMTAVTNV